MKKYCGKCNTTKKIVDFAFKDKSKGIRQSRCKSCQKEYTKKHYLDNKKEYKARAIKRNKEVSKKIKEYVRSYKESLGCADCGISYDHWILQFDHVTSTKKYNISNMVKTAHSMETLQKEIDKCEVVCANCHSDRTWKRGILSRNGGIARHVGFKLR